MYGKGEYSDAEIRSEDVTSERRVYKWEEKRKLNIRSYFILPSVLVGTCRT
jgi:hypothetical protein